MPDFRSDTVTQPTPAMREAMFQAPLGDDVFADDPSVNALQDHAAELLGFEAALFAPSGTQTNLIALWGHCQRGDEAIVGQSWHTYRWEAGGMAVLGSIQPQPVETQPDGTLRVADIAAAIKPDDPHFARTRLVVLENTTGGQVLPPAYIAEVAQLARSRGLAMHLDGARMFNAATANAARNGTDVYAEARALCSHFDSASLCLSKGLGAPVGSLVLGSRDFIRQARRTRKILGGGMRQAGVLAAAGHYALQPPCAAPGGRPRPPGPAGPRAVRSQPQPPRAAGQAHRAAVANQHPLHRPARRGGPSLHRLAGAARRARHQQPVWRRHPAALGDAPGCE